jgi:hypothetical protein
MILLYSNGLTVLVVSDDIYTYIIELEYSSHETSINPFYIFFLNDAKFCPSSLKVHNLHFSIYRNRFLVLTSVLYVGNLWAYSLLYEYSEHLNVYIIHVMS